MKDVYQGYSKSHCSKQLLFNSKNYYIYHMKRILFICFLLSTQFIDARDKFVGIRIGASASDITQQRRFFDSTFYRIGINFGLTYDYNIRKHLHVGADLLYFENGFDVKTFVMYDNPDMLLRRAVVHYNFNYLALPLRAGVHYGNKLFGFTNMAMIPSFLLSAKAYAPKFEYPNDIIKYKLRKDVRKYDIAASFETSIGFKPAQKYQYYFSCYVYHSLTPFNINNLLGGSNAWHKGMLLSIGMKYKLGKEKVNKPLE